jgi:hypothetical protein
MSEAAIGNGETLVATGDGGGRGDSGRTGGPYREREGASNFSMIPLGWLAGGCSVVGLILYGVQQALRLPSAFGIEDILGWQTPAVISAAVLNWCPPISDRWWGAAGYILADTALFMPFYGALILAAARSLGAALQPGPAPFARLLKITLQPATWLLVSALWVIDGIENFAGAERVGVSTWTFLVALIVAALLFARLWRTVLADEDTRRQHTCWNGGVLIVALLIVAALVAVQDKAAACAALSHPGTEPYGLSWAHNIKPALILLALSPIAFASLIWWFGIDLDLLDHDQELMAEFRAAWRAGVAGVIGRTRYVLLMLGLFATFTLVLDQSRDVLLALTGPLGDLADRGFAAMAWRVLVLILGAGSIAMLAYSSWLWTRLVGMVKRPGLALPGDHAVYDWVGEFARGWARAVSMAPLAIVCLLIAHTAGDAAAAARVGPASETALASTLSYLFLFGALAVVGGYVFLQIRRQLPLYPPARYYNSEPDVYTLLREGTAKQRRVQQPTSSPIEEEIFSPQEKAASCFAGLHARLVPLVKVLAPFVRKLIPITRPVVWPLVALALMVLVRAGMALSPDTTAQAPATLALLCLALNWWMGAAGAISLAEQRQTIPWGIVLIGIVGLLSTVVDNHVLPLSVIKVLPPEATLDALRAAGFVVTLLLTALGAVWWLAATYSRRPPGSAPVSKAGSIKGILKRAGIALAAFLVVVPVLRIVDQQTTPLFVPSGPPEMRTLDTALDHWASKLAELPGTDKRVFLVASEGGGIRSAYWTARVLAELHDRGDSLHFDQRTVVLSGVSGGAIGEAVYRACLHQDRSGRHVLDCVKTRFAHLDALSPLIGGLMFEDVFARILPLDGMSICEQPGCGFLSRALGFEREWMRQFPALAEPIARWREGEPELMLNSTEVESGNRVVFSTLRLPPHDTPASVDAVRRLGGQVSLIAAGHAAARFPFTNPLAELRPGRGVRDAGQLVGHLADGGYHDNSGAESLADVWRVLRAKMPSGWHAQLVLIRNGQVKPRCEGRPHTEPLPICLEAVRTRGNLAAPVDKPLLDLYADLLGPPVAVVNVSGIGAHARQAAGALNADIDTQEPRRDDSNPRPQPCLLDQTTAATLVPLGWYLSPSARDALEAEVLDALAQPDCFPASL